MNASILRITDVLGGVVVTGIVLVLLSIASVNVIDTLVIERATAQDSLDAFLRTATAISRIVANAQDFRLREGLVPCCERCREGREDQMARSRSGALG